VNAGGLKGATNLPGFPTDSYLTFALAVPFMQGALFSVMNAGTDLARDIETGFLNRLALTPLRGAALLSGLLAGAVVLGLLQAVGYLAVGLLAGANLAAGAGGALVIVVLAVSITVAFGSIGLFAALRSGSGEAVQSLFPVFFVFLFLSSMALPLELIQGGKGFRLDLPDVLSIDENTNYYYALAFMAVSGGILFGLSRSARGRNKARTPSRHSALTPSGSISTGSARARSNRPASRSRRCRAAFSG